MSIRAVKDKRPSQSMCVCVCGGEGGGGGGVVLGLSCMLHLTDKGRG